MRMMVPLIARQYRIKRSFLAYGSLIVLLTLLLPGLSLVQHVQAAVIAAISLLFMGRIALVVDAIRYQEQDDSYAQEGRAAIKARLLSVPKPGNPET